MLATRIVPLLFAICLSLCLEAPPLSAAASGLFTYSVQDGFITITRYPTSAVGEVVIPASISGKTVTSIGNYAFEGCGGLTHVKIPSSVTRIGEGAFDGCTSLTGLTIPPGVTTIGDSAFSGCASLTGVAIPGSVSSLGAYLFIGCDALSAVEVDAANPKYSSQDGGLYNKRRTVLVLFPPGKKGDCLIPSGVTRIGDSAFDGCAGLKGVKIPSSVTSIGYGAFNGCSGLTGVTIPPSVTAISEYAFDGCASLTQVTIPPGVTSIGESAFEDCASLTSVTLPSSVTSIGYAAFEYCSALTSVTIPNSVTSIGDNAFEYCIGLASVTIPGSVTSIGDSAFSGCIGLTHVKIPSSVTSLAAYIFAGCTGMTHVTISSGVINIGWSAFEKCTSLTDVTIPASVTSIRQSAFLGCSSLARANFIGNAPKMQLTVTDSKMEVFNDTSPGFTVYFTQGSLGFTTPKWHGYPAIALAKAPDIGVQQPAGSGMVDGYSKRSFGTVRIGTAGNEKTFRIINTGTKDLTGLAITKDGVQKNDFIITALIRNSLPPGASTTFKVKFKPTATGTRNSAIHILSNDANENPFDIKITGLGVN